MLRLNIVLRFTVHSQTVGSNVNHYFLIKNNYCDYFFIIFEVNKKQYDTKRPNKTSSIRRTFRRYKGNAP